MASGLLKAAGMAYPLSESLEPLSGLSWNGGAWDLGLRELWKLSQRAPAAAGRLRDYNRFQLALVLAAGASFKPLLSLSG